MNIPALSIYCIPMCGSFNTRKNMCTYKHKQESSLDTIFISIS